MKNEEQMLIWSDGWWIEDNKAWFVCAMSNGLFCADMDTGEFDKVASIPDSDEQKYRLTPKCLKYGRDIFCLPGFGKSIWVYNLDDNAFTEIEIDKPERHQLASQFWILDDTIFIVPGNWNKVIEVSASQKIITNYYIICEDDSIRQSVLVGDKIYAVSSGFGKIYQFDLVTKKVSAYYLPDSELKLHTISFDGEKFWLSGYKREIYIWDKEKNSFFTINNFPENLDIYEFIHEFTHEIIGCVDKEEEYLSDSFKYPAFICSVVVGGYVWLIPSFANKIVYINKENSVVSALRIYEEYETKEITSWRQSWGIGNYLLEYVRENRYIGLFSTRNSRILEIDVIQLSYQWREYYFSDKYLWQHCEECNGIYYEGKNPVHSQAYRRELRTVSYRTNSANSKNVGMKIYTKMMEEGMQ